MKKSLLIIVATLLVIGSSYVAMAAGTCRILSIDKVGEGIYELTINPEPLLEPGFSGEWFFLEGPQDSQGTERPIEQRGNVVVATLHGRNAGELIQFSCGRGGDTWLVPGCPEETQSFNHFGVILPHDRVPPPDSLPLPFMSILLKEDVK